LWKVYRETRSGGRVQLLNQFTALETLDISIASLTTLPSPTHFLELVEFEGGYYREEVIGVVERDRRGREVGNLSAEKVLGMVRDAVPGWKMPVVRLCW